MSAWLRTTEAESFRLAGLAVERSRLQRSIIDAGDRRHTKKKWEPSPTRRCRERQANNVKAVVELSE
jgi:hypothetical protein